MVALLSRPCLKPAPASPSVAPPSPLLWPLHATVVAITFPAKPNKKIGHSLTSRPACQAELLEVTRRMDDAINRRDADALRTDIFMPDVALHPGAALF